jgi:hypothetical protein
MGQLPVTLMTRSLNEYSYYSYMELPFFSLLNIGRAFCKFKKCVSLLVAELGHVFLNAAYLELITPMKFLFL